LKAHEGAVIARYRQIRNRNCHIITTATYVVHLPVCLTFTCRGAAFAGPENGGPKKTKTEKKQGWKKLDPESERPGYMKLANNATVELKQRVG